MTDIEVLRGSRVTLRAPTLDDAEALFDRVAADPEVTRYLSWSPHPDVDETRRVITFEGRLVRYAVLPNISAEPQDCLMFAKALR